MTRRNMETAVMARPRRGQSGQGSELARAGHSAVKLLRRLFTLRELWWQFCAELEKTAWYFLQILPFFSLGNSCIAQ